MIIVQLILLGLFEHLELLIELDMPGVEHSHLEEESGGADGETEGWQDAGENHWVVIFIFLNY